MPIDLPQALLPENHPTAQVKGQAPVQSVVEVLGTRIHIMGTKSLDPAELEKRIKPSADLSQAVLAIQAMVYEKGYPNAVAHYALVDKDLYVLVVQNPITRVEVPRQLNRYFSDLVGKKVITDHDLEPRRSMANIHADRANIDGALSFEKNSDPGLTLAWKPKPVNRPRFRAQAGFGNPGNRFLGPYFGDYAISDATSGGIEFSFNGRHALGQLNEDEGPGRYSEQGVQLSRVGTYGVFGLVGRNINFDQRQSLDGFDQDLALDGKLQQATLNWTYVPYAGFTERLSVGAEFERTKKQLTAPEFDDTQLQFQEYNSIRLSADYTQGFKFLGHDYQVSAGLQLEKGLNSDRSDEAPILADLGFLLIRPTLVLQTSFLEGYSAQFSISGQASDDRLPEQRQWLLGGAGMTESHMPGVAIGDYGTRARAQFGIPVFALGALRVFPTLFAEYGNTQLNVRSTDGESPLQRITDVGAALAIGYGRHFEATLAYAEEIDSSGIDSQQLRDSESGLLFRVSFKL